MKPILIQVALELNPSSEITFDVELSAQVTDNAEIIVGAANLFDNQPDLNPVW